MSRTSAREHAFKILFQMQFVRTEPKDSITAYLESFAEDEVSETDRSFIEGEVEGTLSHVEAIDQSIEGSLEGWSLYRLSKVDLCIMRLAVYEILYDPSIPPSVSINEAVNLAKRYSQDAAPAFINGVLGGLLQAES